MTEKTINIFTENIYPEIEIDETDIISTGRSVVEYYLETIVKESCLEGFNFDTLTFDILFCDSKKTHEINREYRDKDAPADIITFAIFADDESKFILDNDINLGEIIIATDLLEKNAKDKGWTTEYELKFLVAHGILHLLGFDHQTEVEYNFVVDCQTKALKYALEHKNEKI